MGMIYKRSEVFWIKYTTRRQADSRIVSIFQRIRC